MHFQVREEDQLSRIPALKTWFRTSRAVVMHLTNGTMQINFFKDHTKVCIRFHIFVTFEDSNQISKWLHLVKFLSRLILWIVLHRFIFRLSFAHSWALSPTLTRRARTGPSGGNWNVDLLRKLKWWSTVENCLNFLFRFDLLEKHGCTTELASRLTYAYDKVIIWQSICFRICWP